MSTPTSGRATSGRGRLAFNSEVVHPPPSPRLIRFSRGCSGSPFIPRSLCRKIKLPTIDVGERRFLTPGEVEDLARAKRPGSRIFVVTGVVAVMSLLAHCTDPAEASFDLANQGKDHANRRRGCVFGLLPSAPKGGLHPQPRPRLTG